MKKLTTQELIDINIKYTIMAYEAMEDSDYKTNNRCVRKKNSLLEKHLNNDIETALAVYGALLKHEHDRVRSVAAVDALRMNILIDESVAVLEEVSKRKGLVGFGAGMALKVYRGESFDSS